MAYFIIQERNNPIFGTVYYCEDGSGYCDHKADAKRFATKAEAMEWGSINDEELGGIVKVIKVKE